jgi:hypothetical protein
MYVYIPPTGYCVRLVRGSAGAIVHLVDGHFCAHVEQSRVQGTVVRVDSTGHYAKDARISGQHVRDCRRDARQNNVTIATRRGVPR